MRVHWLIWLGFTSAVLGFLCVGGEIGDAIGYQRGVQDTEAREIASRAEHDRVMRKVGLCSWAKVMAAEIQCRNEFKPGEP